MKSINKIMMFSVVIAMAMVTTCFGTTTPYAGIDAIENWFSVDVSAATLSAAPWTAPSYGTAEISGENIVLNNAMSLTYTPVTTPMAASEYATTTFITITPNPCEEDVESADLPDGAQAVIYMFKDTSNDNALSWRAMTSSGVVTLSGATPLADTTYVIKVDFDYASTPNRVRFAVKASGTSDYTTLTCNSSEWLTNLQSDADNLAAIDFCGTGTLGDFSAENRYEAEVKIDTTGYASLKKGLEAAAANDTVTLLKNVSAAETITTTTGGACNLDCGGYYFIGSLAPSAAITMIGGAAEFGDNTTDNVYLSAGYFQSTSQGAASLANGMQIVAMLSAKTVGGTTFGYEMVKTTVTPEADQVAVDTGDGYAVVVDKDWMTEHGLDPTSDPSGAATAMTETGANGIKRVDSYVLGLNPTVSTSKPIIKAVQDTNTDKVTFCLADGSSGNAVTPASNCGATAKFRVGTMSTPSGDPTYEGTYTEAGSTVTMALPASGVQYYSLDVVIEQ